MASSTPLDKVLSANKEIHLPGTHQFPLYRAIDIDSHKGNDRSMSQFRGLLQETLTKIVREKDVVSLHEHMEVEGIASALEIDL